MKGAKNYLAQLDPLKLYAIAAFFLAATPFFLFSSEPGGVCFSLPIAIVAYRRARRLQGNDPKLPGTTQTVSAVARLHRRVHDRYSDRTR